MINSVMCLLQPKARTISVFQLIIIIKCKVCLVGKLGEEKIYFFNKMKKRPVGLGSYYFILFYIYIYK